MYLHMMAQSLPALVGAALCSTLSPASPNTGELTELRAAKPNSGSVRALYQEGYPLFQVKERTNEGLLLEMAGTPALHGFPIRTLFFPHGPLPYLSSPDLKEPSLPGTAAIIAYSLAALGCVYSLRIQYDEQKNRLIANNKGLDDDSRLAAREQQNLSRRAALVSRGISLGALGAGIFFNAHAASKQTVGLEAAYAVGQSRAIPQVPSLHFEIELPVHTLPGMNNDNVQLVIARSADQNRVIGWTLKK
jgi:hypothetical protein